MWVGVGPGVDVGGGGVAGEVRGRCGWGQG